MLKKTWNKVIESALAEDIGSGDITATLIPTSKKCSAKLITRENAIICGCDIAEAVFHQVDENIKIDWYVKDGETIFADQLLCEVTGFARAILTAERTALNFLQLLSGIATKVNKYKKLMGECKTKILDTRKTIPLLRDMQKYAVTCGGGLNHRFGLYDAFLIKENHIKAAGGIAQAVEKARAINQNLLIEVEVENLEELHIALNVGVTRIMLDNFSLDEIKQAVKINQNRAELEVSGNITACNIQEIASTNVTYVSLGDLTKNISALDLSLRISDAD